VTFWRGFTSRLRILENIKSELDIVKCYCRRVKSYGQYCAIARGLDVVGDRWTLLIVRELLFGPRRYSDLQDGLAGIATNLLTDRLRHLEQHGVVDRDSRGTYELTKWGEGLAGPIYALARWGGPLMAKPAGDDQFRSEWLVPVVAGIFGGVDPSRPEVNIAIHTGDSPMTVISTQGRVLVQPGAADYPDLVISGPPEGVIGILAGALDKAAAYECGVVVQGDVRRLARLRGTSRPRVTS
jgi:DNA-binding HxlR family transcriptional regulator